ncbi:MAG: Maf family protein [Proteobacteria bacterium]|nr:Maf family protein [Pseudomonadota bacterium]
MKKLLLASGSPRRAQLLTQLGLTFDVLLPEIDERNHACEQARRYVDRMSLEKSTKARKLLGEKFTPDLVVLCADTIVSIDDQILGKPQDKDDALRMLMLLSDREHQVLTSVTVAGLSRHVTFQVETIVCFRQLTVVECEAYWNRGESSDKAGSYGIQGLGANFVHSMNGSYSNVMGLPLVQTADTLRSFGLDCLEPDEMPFELK